VLVVRRGHAAAARHREWRDRERAGTGAHHRRARAASRRDPARALRARMKLARPRRRLRAGPLPATRSAYSRIYDTVTRIPRGRVATYGQVAELAGIARAPRVAGYALHALPQGSPVPWHRVVAVGGRLSLARLDPH